MVLLGEDEKENVQTLIAKAKMVPPVAIFLMR